MGRCLLIRENRQEIFLLFLICQLKSRPLNANGRLWMGKWWSWGDLNPRPQALFGQIYMFSGLI